MDIQGAHGDRGLLITLGIALVMLATTAHAQQVDAPEADSEPLTAVAEKTYALLLDEYRSGKSGGPLHLELLNNWSKRIVLAELAAKTDPAAGAAERIKRAQQKHRRRMATLEKIVRARSTAGLATLAEAAASRFFLLESDQLQERLLEWKLQAAERDFRIELPDPRKAVPLAPQPKELFIEILQDGTCRIAGKPLTLKELDGKLAAAAKEPERPKVLIRADARTTFDNVVRVMNLCQKHVFDYSVAVDKAKE